MQRLVTAPLLLTVLYVPSCIAVWILPVDSKICENDVIKSIANYSLVQCIASCRRSTECHTVSFTKNKEESKGKCLHLKESSGSCGKETVMNDADAANTNRIEAVKKAVESAEDGANYRVMLGSLNCYSFRDEVFE